MAEGADLIFEWDEDKARSNVRKHGVRFEDAETVFKDKWALSVYDLEHSFSEDRWNTVGKDATGHLLTISHTEEASSEGQTRIRLISARTATPREKRYYEEEPR
jgi:uncharacterized DUF497 family protein